jgi:hypothetical protein
LYLKTPVALFVFNRPETTARVFEIIRRARPPILLLVADDARLTHQGEVERVAATRSIIEQVDWPCQILKNYSTTNLGCRRRVSSGLDWVFQMVERAIILEDDCLPHPTFFQFCEDLLEKYKDDENVMHISGNNFQFDCNQGESSYYFSRYAHVWGWASWRRAWRHYDVQMKRWVGAESKDVFLNGFTNLAEKRFWKVKWDEVSAGKIDTWDFQWVFACLGQKSLSIVPNVNLVSNIGFGVNATHTSSISKLADIPTVAIEFPLVHPHWIVSDIKADEYTARLFFRLGLVKYLAKIGQRFFYKCIGFLKGWRNAL